MRKRLLTVFCISVLVTATPAVSLARSAYPNKPVRLIVGFTAGGTIDLTARILGQALQQKLGQPFVVENKVGANGVLAAEHVAQAGPDGHTLFVSNSSTITLNPTLFKGKLRYEPQRDFAPVSTVVSVPLVLAINAQDPASEGIRTVADLVAKAKVEPGRINYGSAGNGNITHVAFELFSDMAGVKMTHVPYKGAAAAQAALFAKEVTVILDTLSALQHIRSGRLRPPAVSSNKRLAELPKVPTLQEAGFAGFDISFWVGVFAPRNTPPTVIETLNHEIAAAAHAPRTAEKLAAQGVILIHSPSAFAAKIAAETAQLGSIVKKAAIQAD